MHHQLYTLRMPAQYLNSYQKERVLHCGLMGNWEYRCSPSSAMCFVGYEQVVFQFSWLTQFFEGYQTPDWMAPLPLPFQADRIGLCQGEQGTSLIVIISVLTLIHEGCLQRLHILSSQFTHNRILQHDNEINRIARYESFLHSANINGTTFYKYFKALQFVPQTVPQDYHMKMSSIIKPQFVPQPVPQDSRMKMSSIIKPSLKGEVEVLNLVTISFEILKFLLDCSLQHTDSPNHSQVVKFIKDSSTVNELFTTTSWIRP